MRVDILAVVSEENGWGVETVVYNLRGKFRGAWEPGEGSKGWVASNWLEKLMK
jgi:hypothetical protein